MEATRINHVSVNASDLGASVRFYVEVLGATPIATPNFGFPVQWLGLGDTQVVLLALSVVVGALTVLPGRATLLEGGIHIAIFCAFLFLAVNP